MVQQGKKEIESIKRYIEVDLDKYRPRVSSMDISRVSDIWDAYGENLKGRQRGLTRKWKRNSKRNENTISPLLYPRL